MSKINDGGPVSGQWVYDERGVPVKIDGGLTIRDAFAQGALMGILAHQFEDGSDFLHELGPGAAAYQAYRFADAMLSARSNREEDK